MKLIGIIEKRKDISLFFSLESYDISGADIKITPKTNILVIYVILFLEEQEVLASDPKWK